MVAETKSSHADCHFAASTVAAIINFPLWKASSIAQSGFKIEASNPIIRYYKAVTHPPFRGILATIGGMAWARGAIFFGSDYLREKLVVVGASDTIGVVLPPLVVSTLVQIANQPLVRATITIQNPESSLGNVRAALAHIYSTRGVSGLWHGVSAGIMKTVPKYITAVAVKDYMEAILPRPNSDNKQAHLYRSAIKAVVAGAAGAILTNPLDVIRNEMFKTDQPLGETVKRLMREEGWSFMTRGIASNTTAVAIPVTLTIFLTDLFISFKTSSY